MKLQKSHAPHRGTKVKLSLPALYSTVQSVC